MKQPHLSGVPGEPPPAPALRHSPGRSATSPTPSPALREASQGPQWADPTRGPAGVPSPGKTRPLVSAFRTIRVAPRVMRRSTGYYLKLRFLLALTLLSLLPTFVLTLLVQQVEQQTIQQSQQSTLQVLAQHDLASFRQELQRRQAVLDLLAKSIGLADLGQGTTSGSALQQAQNTLATEQDTFGDSIAWIVLNASNHIVVAAPNTLEGQDLTAGLVVSPLDDLVKFVQEGHQPPNSPQAESDLHLAVSQGKGKDSNWLALETLFSPEAPQTSAILLAIFSLSAVLQPALQTASEHATSYALVVNDQEQVVGAGGNGKIQALVGTTLNSTPLQDTEQTIRSSDGQERGGTETFHDPYTQAISMVAGSLLPEGGLVILTVAAQDDLPIPSSGLLSARNLPIVFLALTVVAVLIAAAVALPIVRPIRGATREITKTKDDVQSLANQAQQIADNQRVGTEILKNAAHGLSTRAGSIRHDVQFIEETVTRLLSGRFAAIAPYVEELSPQAQERLKILLVDIYRELQQIQALSSHIVSSLTTDRALRTLGEAMEGAGEISKQFDDASKTLHEGVHRLERASDALL
jgi:hypothetical protein